MNTLRDQDLPPFFEAADRAAARAQSSTMSWTRLRLAGTIAGAVGGAFTLTTLRFDVWAWVALAGFVVALAADLYMALESPERRWYQARAAAESAKTLSWRYAVGGDPFFVSLGGDAAEALLSRRIAQVAKQVSDAVRMPEGNASEATGAMRRLRHEPFAERQEAYLRWRTQSQRDWYASKASTNAAKARLWRAVLIVAELVGIVLAAGRVFGSWNIDLAGILSSVIAACAAWLAIKQHSTLRAAYSLTAAELEKQIAAIRSAPEGEWAQVVADAEEAISREHTMWLASRGEVNESLS